MAFFRTGGGGIPAALKSAMNAVLNKKFGTTTTYLPDNWPDDVNLMGVLEEKTVSASPIASFSDGADGVPVKNWLVTLPASLDGYSAIGCTKSGKNLASGGVYEYEYNARNMIIAPVYLRAGTYTVSFNRGVNVQYIYIRKGETVSLVGDAYAKKSNSTFFTFAADEDTYYYAQLYRTNTSDTWEDYPVTQPQIEVGSTATAYEPYEAPTTYTASLGRTVYGGTADIVTGEGEDEYIKYVIDGVNNYAINVSGTNFNIMPYGLFIDGTISKWVCDALTANSTNFGYNSSQGFIFIRQAGWSSLTGVTDVATFNTYCQNNPITLILPKTTSETFTFTPITPTPETPLGVSNWWADEGDSGVTYRSSGTVTPIVPTLISKTITENGTYSAEDDDADGYSEVIVNVQGGGEEPFVPQFSETLIGDNTAHASSFTLTEDYANYDMVKIVWYESATSSGFLYTTPDILDEIFTIGVGKLCVNKPSTNYYVCYTKNGLTWTQTNQRVLFVHEIYGVTFTNCTMTSTDLYKRGASTTDKHTVTSQTSLKDYDLFMMASIHATDGSETMPTTWLYQYPPENMGDAFSCPVPTVLQEYNANDEAFVISEYGMTAARYFMVQGIKFTAVSSSRGLMMASRPVTQLVGEESDPDQVNELVENDETEQEGEDDA